MRFLRPDVLWLLLALPLLAVAGAWSAARARQAMRRFAGGEAFTGRFRAEVSGHRRAVKVLLIYVGLVGLTLAAARPQWGTRMEPVTRRGVDVVILLDTSLSMAAQDVAPSRLGQARNAIDSLLKGLEGNRVALVTFAGQATLNCPLTLDHAAVRLFLDAVEAETMQVPGTALAEALTLARRTFGEIAPGDDERTRAVVVFTDGEDHEGGLDEVIPDLEGAGIGVYGVGCGTSRGAPIPVRDADTVGYKKDREGKVVTTRLDETVLQALGLQTGGGYWRATADEQEVGEILRALTELESREYGAVLRARYEERYQIPLAVALVALIAETLVGDRRRIRSATGEVRR